MACPCTGACVCEPEAIVIADGRACAEADPCTDLTMVLPNQALADAVPGVALKQLTPDEARRTIVHRQQKHIDRARQQLVKIGLRPYNVDLVWVAWTGDERGDGYEKIIKRISLVPNPVVVDLTSINMSVVATGVLPVGSVRLEKVSACYTSDALLGRLAEAPKARFEFYYEIWEDGRTGPSDRMKFRPSSTPYRDLYGWKISLERISQDGTRDGKPSEVAP